jgi:hypothetical protein
MHPSGRTTQEEAEEARTRAAGGTPGVGAPYPVSRDAEGGAYSERVEGRDRAGWGAITGAAGVGRMIGEGQDRTDRHKELVPEGERTRTAEQVVVQVDSLVGHIGPEVGRNRKEHLDLGSRS